LCKDSPTAAILPVAGPGNDITSVSTHGDGGHFLDIRIRGGVYQLIGMHRKAGLPVTTGDAVQIPVE